MNTESLKKFSADLVKDFQAALVKNHTDELVEKIKAAQDASSFKVVISTADEDRQGDKLDQTKWNLSNYKANPVVLWAHDYHSLPIGVCTGITVENGELVAEGKFADAELNPFAAQVAGLYAAGFIKATSVGFIIHEDESLELLEFSFVPVPANPFALSMREMKKLNLDIPQLVMKGLTFQTKAEQEGDTCTMEDGTDGVLSEDANNPGKLVCVPSESGKAMDNDLTKSLKAENTRHGAALTKAIEEFSKSAVQEDESAKPDTDKDFSEFNEKAASEQDEHLAKSMKAIDENYELQDQKKSVDEFKAAFQAEHGNHVKCFGKSVDEFKDAFQDGDHSDRVKAIEDFTKAVGAELGRHEKAQMDVCAAEMAKEKKSKGAVADEMTEDKEMQAKYKKIDKAYSVFSAFISAYLDEKAAVEDYDTLLAEAVALMKNTETKSYPDSTIRPLIGKSGRAISAATKEKIKAIITTLETHNTEHGDATQKQIAALKDLMGPDGSEGEDGKPQKEVIAPKRKVEVRDIRSANDTFEAFMATRQVLRTVDSAVGKSLEDLNKRFKEFFPNRR